MLIHTKELLEYEKRPLIGINSRFDKLLVALPNKNDQGHLDKSQTSFDNVLDAFRLSLRHLLNIETEGQSEANYHNSFIINSENI